ncbi:MAG: hypothetical protein EOP48_14830 [Sphingobacteriales bacterium]|nr:MAG: hypothetical protein EOP48_14830 [Sphingobacteriales bacterium]
MKNNLLNLLYPNLQTFSRMAFMTLHNLYATARSTKLYDNNKGGREFLSPDVYDEVIKLQVFIL